MQVRIDDGLYIESDEHQYILKRYTGKTITMNKGKEDEYAKDDFKVIGFYGTITQAINKVISDKIKISNAKDLYGLRQDIQAIKQWVENKMEGF